MIYNGNTYYYVRNLMGEIIGLVDDNGVLVGRYYYDPWGELTGLDNYTSQYIASINPIRYKDYYYDSELGFYYLNSRYYDPETSRFINADSLLNQETVLGFNMFAYCLNNPISMADTSGNLPFFAITAAIGAVAGAIIGGVTAAKSGGNVWAGIGVGAAAGALIGTGAGMAAGAALAGSITATTAQVAIGAGALVSIVESAGVVAGAKMVLDNISQATTNAPQVFWSGGDLAKNASQQFANDISGKTLEMTRLGIHLDRIDASYSTWQAASANFANVAHNAAPSIYSIQNSAGVNLQSTWATIEYPLLQGRDIIYGVVSQSGTITIMQ